MTGPSAKKKARQFAPGQPLRSVLFELFEQQPYWTIKELRTAAIHGGCDAAAAKRGEAEIRDILRSEIGEYHRSGDHKNKWELRKEFQQYSGSDMMGLKSSSNNMNNSSGSNPP